MISAVAVCPLLCPNLGCSSGVKRALGALGTEICCKTMASQVEIANMYTIFFALEQLVDGVDRKYKRLYSTTMDHGAIFVGICWVVFLFFKEAPWDTLTGDSTLIR